MLKGKKLLFLTWDSDLTQYLEGLFLPIFRALSDDTDLEIHIFQCSWAGQEKVKHLEQVCYRQHIRYTHLLVQRKPHPLIGTWLAVLQAGKAVLAYCKEHEIDFLMPRSTMPAWIVNRIYKKLPDRVKIILDADGLPIEERVDFAGLKKGSLMYALLKSIESTGLKNASAVLTRSKKAIDFLIKQHGLKDPSKFHEVINGRDAELFKPSSILRQKTREVIGIKEEEKLLIYAGSLGPQYGIQEMLELTEKASEQIPVKALFLTGNPDYLKGKIPASLQDLIIVKQVNPAQVPDYLNAADMAFAIREPKLSMIGVAPIKLGEYLLSGLPTIASKGIGDTEVLLKEAKDCHIFDHADSLGMEKALTFLLNAHSNKEALRELGKTHFSLEASVASYRNALLGLC